MSSATSRAQERTLGALLPQALVFLIVSFAFWRIHDCARISIFQERDLFRAGLFAHGHFLLSGPELSGGGNLPGPFYYALLALSQLVQTGWRSAYALLCCLQGISVALAFGFFLRRFGRSAAWLFLAVCFLTHFLNVQVIQFWNPSFLPFLTFVYLAFCEQIYFEGRCSLRFRFLLFFFCGLCLQFHSLGIIFFLHAIIDAHWLRKRPWKETLANFAIFLLPSLPYLVSVALSRNVDLSGAVSYFHAYLEDSYFSHRRWPIAVPIFTAITFLPSLRKNPFFRSYALLFLLALPPALIALQDARVGRYGIIGVTASTVLITAGLLQLRMVFTLPLLVAAAGMQVFGLMRHPAYAIILSHEYDLTTLLLAVLLVAALRTSGWSIRKVPALSASALFAIALNASQMRMHAIKTGLAANSNEFVAKKIYASTGWSFEKAAQRIFFVNTRREIRLYYSYLSAVQKYSPPVDHPKFDGFLILQTRKEGFAYEETERVIPAYALKPILEQVGLEKTLASALTNGDLEIFDGSNAYGVAVIPYRRNPDSDAPINFQNYGRTYLSKPFDRSVSSSDGAYSFHIHECSAPEMDCEILARIDLKGTDDNRTTAAVLIDGAPISYPDFALTPNWAETLISPYLLFQCGSAPLRRREIAGRIGPLPEAPLLPHHLLTSNFLAPYGFDLVLDCPRNQLKQIGFGFRSSVIKKYRNWESESLPGQELIYSAAKN